MTDYIISSKLSNETVYAYYRGRFWRWDRTSIWKESHLMTQKFERAKAADKADSARVPDQRRGVRPAG